jgi:hypothetical protein
MLRILSRHRVLLAAGAVIALLAAVAYVYRISPSSPHFSTRTTTSGVASTRVLITAKASEESVEQSDLESTLGTRAELLADLMATDQTRGEIAAGAGVKADDVAVVTPAMGGPIVPVPIATLSSQAAANQPALNVIGVSADGQIPIVTIRGYAPDAPRATRLVNSASDALRKLLRTQAKSGTFATEPLGGVVTATRVESPSRMLGAIVFLFLFVMWSAAIVFFAGLYGHWKRRQRRSAIPAPSA